MIMPGSSGVYQRSHGRQFDGPHALARLGSTDLRTMDDPSSYCSALMPESRSYDATVVPLLTINASRAVAVGSLKSALPVLSR